MSKRKSLGVVGRPIFIHGSDSDSDNASELCFGGDSDAAAASHQSKKLDTQKFEHYLGILSKKFPKDKKASFAFLDSLWFSLYMQKPTKEKVLQWIQQKHILSKKYVAVPIVYWSHWNLLILCHLGASSESKTGAPCMLLLDSLHMADPRRLEPDIRKYVFHSLLSYCPLERFVMDIYEVEKKPEKKAFISKIPFLIPKVPQQRNAEDCGLFVLYFLNRFVQSAPKNFNVEEGYPYFMKEDWFCHEDVDRFFTELSQHSQ